MNYCRLIQCCIQRQKLSYASIFIFMALVLFPVALPASDTKDKKENQKENLSNKKIKIKGYVFDNNRIPLYGAVVAESGTTNATIADENGAYSIDVVPKEGLRLQFSFLGMKTQLIEVFKRTVIDVTLEPLEGKLEEVVVTGYGNIVKEAYTGSASIITSDDIKNRAISSFENLLNGLSPGLVSASSGQPGDIAEVRLRGFGSMDSNNQPLYVIDGVVFDQDNTSGHSSAVSSPMATINPADIANITILKDAASASLYGSQGANGVIVITTKQGVPSDRIRYTFSAQAGISQVFSAAIPDLVNSEQYKELWTEGELHSLIRQQGGNFTDNLTKLYGNKLGYSLNGKNYYQWEKIAKQNFNNYYAIPRSDGTYMHYDYWGADKDKLPNVDWYDEIMRTAVFQQYDFSLSGGSSNLKYYLSLGYLDEEGVMLNSKLKRYSGRFNMSADDKKKLVNWGVSLNIGQTDQTGPVATGVLFNQPHYAALLLPNVVPAYLDDGSYNFQFPNNLLNGNHNPIASALENKRSRPQFNLNMVAWLRLNFTKWLDLRSDISEYYITGHRSDYFDKDFGSGYGGNGDLTVYDSKRVKITNKNMLNFNHTFRSRHRINATVGLELADFRQEWNSTSVVNFMTDDKPVLSSGAEVSSWSGNGYDYSQVSLVSRADYSYRNRYFLGGSFRQDKSSRFAPEHRVGNFWSVSGAYRITNENWKWIKSIDHIINDIKFKGSYGHNGTLPSKYYNWRTLFNGTDRYNSEHALSQSYRGTYDLSWEKNKIYNIGVDFRLFKSKIKVSAEYFQRKSSDLLQNVPVSQVSGYSRMLMNTSAGINNKGLEFDIDANIVDNLFKWDVRLNMATLSAKYYGLEQDIIGTHIMRNGESVSSWYMNKYAGINSFTGEVQYYGIDENGNDIISSSENPSERRIIGKGIPTATGGFSTMFSYQGCELSALFTYGWGHKVYDSRVASRTGLDGQSMDYDLDVRQLDRWNPDNIYGTSRIRINGQTSAGSSSRYLYDGDYLKLKNIKLQYVFPASTFRNLGINGVSTFAQVENLWVWTDLDGYDPDMQIDGNVNAARYPSATTFTVGFNLNF